MIQTEPALTHCQGCRFAGPAYTISAITHQHRVAATQIRSDTPRKAAAAAAISSWNAIALAYVRRLFSLNSDRHWASPPCAAFTHSRRAPDHGEEWLAMSTGLPTRWAGQPQRRA